MAKKKDVYRMTDIVKRKNSPHEVSISLDESYRKEGVFGPMLLVVGDKTDYIATHYHIDLTDAEARKLHKWLSDYLKPLEKP